MDDKYKLNIYENVGATPDVYIKEMSSWAKKLEREGKIARVWCIQDNRIQDAKFKTFGCGAAVATSSMATELVKGKTVQEALQVTNKAVMEALNGLPPVKVHCSLLAEEAIHAALWDYAQKNHIQIEGLKPPVKDIEEREDEVEEA